MQLLIRRGILKNDDSEKIYLFKNGDTCNSNSGGWILKNAQIKNNYIYIPFNHDPEIQTSKEIETGTLYIDFDRISAVEGKYLLSIFINSSIIFRQQIERGRQILKVDVNNAGILRITSYFYELKIYNIWLEK